MRPVLGHRDDNVANRHESQADIAALETELATARSEQKRLAKAVAMADDVPELVSELRKRSARIAHLEAQIFRPSERPMTSRHSSPASRHRPAPGFTI